MHLLKLGEAEAIRQSLKQERDKHVDVWRLLAKFIAPTRLKEDNQKVDGRKRDQNIINNMAGRSLRTFVSGMMNGATPRSRPWFTLTGSDITAKNFSSARTYFSSVEKVLNNSFQISNFYRVLPMVYKDVAIFSNSAFAQLPHPRYGMYFYPFSMGTYAFSCNEEGSPHMFTRDYAMTVRQVIEEFSVFEGGRINYKDIPKQVVNMYEQGRYMETVVLTTLIVPNKDYDPTDKLMLHPANKRFQSYTWVTGYAGGSVGTQTPVGFRELFGDGKEDKPFIKISGYSYFPVIIPRWEVEAEGFYGVDGPGHVALSDIIELQVLEKYRLAAIEKIVDPPMVGPSSLKRHGSSILAGGITYVDDYTQGQAFRAAIEIPNTINELIGKQEEIQRAISSAFYEDLFMMLNSEKKVSHVTQREIDVRESERMAALTPVLGQWDHDLSSKVISNGIYLLDDAGILEKRPAELEGADIRAEYISTLAQAAKASQMTTVERTLNFASSASQALGDPTLLKLFPGEKIIRDYADYAGYDPELMLSEKDFEGVRATETERLTEERELQKQNVAAKTAKDLSQAQLGNGSMLDEMAGM